MSWLLKLVAPFKGFGAWIGLFVAALMSILFYGRSKKREGRQDAERAQLEKTHEIKRKQESVKRPDPSNLDDSLDGL